MKTKLFLFAVLTASLFACRKENLRNPVLDCIGDVESTFISTGFCDADKIPDFLCEVEDFGEIVLAEESKTFLPQYCEDIGSVLIFENATGEEITYRISSKDYTPLGIIYNKFESCPGDTTKFIGACLSTEALSITLDADDSWSQFIIRLNPQLDRSFDGSYGDFLSINNRIDSTAWGTTFEVIINQRNLDRAETANQEFYPNIQLNEEIYQNVYSHDLIHPLWESYKFYYTKNEGLIGFEDLDDVLWTLKE